MHTLNTLEIAQVTGGTNLDQITSDMITLSENCKDEKILDPLQCPGLCELMEKGKHLSSTDTLGSISFSVAVFEDPYLKACASKIDGKSY